MNVIKTANYFGSQAELVRVLGLSSRSAPQKWGENLPEQYARKLHMQSRSEKQRNAWFPDGHSNKGLLTFKPSIYGVLA